MIKYKGEIGLGIVKAYNDDNIKLAFKRIRDWIENEPEYLEVICGILSDIREDIDKSADPIHDELHRFCVNFLYLRPKTERSPIMFSKKNRIPSGYKPREVLKEATKGFRYLRVICGFPEKEVASKRIGPFYDATPYREDR